MAPLGGLELLYLLQLLDAALHLRRLAGLRLEAIDEALLLRQHGLLPLELRLRLRLVQRPLRLIEIIISAEADEISSVDFDDLGHDPVQKFAVVAGDDQRPLEAPEVALQPDDALDVEVVGGLVEQQGVRSQQQDLRERDPHLPAAAEGAHVAIHARVGEAEPLQDLPRARLQRVAAELLEARLSLPVALDEHGQLLGARGIGHRRLELGELLERGGDGARAGHGLGDRAPSGHLTDVLAEVTERGAAIDGDLAAVRQLLLHEHPKERGLARAVGAHEPHLLSTVDRGGGLRKEDLPAVAFVDAVDADHELGAAPVGGAEGAS